MLLECQIPSLFDKICELWTLSAVWRNRVSSKNFVTEAIDVI